MTRSHAHAARPRVTRRHGLLVILALLTFLILTLAPPAHAASLPLVWSAEYKASANDVYNAVVTAPGGVVYAAGYAKAGASGSNGLLLLAKYVDAGSSGTREWVRTLQLNGARAEEGRGGRARQRDRGRDLEPVGPGLLDIVVLKYSSAGVLKPRSRPTTAPIIVVTMSWTSRSTPAATRSWSGPPSARARGGTTSPSRCAPTAAAPGRGATPGLTTLTQPARRRRRPGRQRLRHRPLQWQAGRPGQARPQPRGHHQVQPRRSAPLAREQPGGAGRPAARPSWSARTRWAWSSPGGARSRESAATVNSVLREGPGRKRQGRLDAHDRRRL